MKVILCTSIILWSNYLVSDAHLSGLLGGCTNLVSGLLGGCSDVVSDVVGSSGNENSADEDCADTGCADKGCAEKGCAKESCADKGCTDEGCGKKGCSKEGCAEKGGTKEGCAEESCSDENRAKESCAQPSPCDRGSCYRNFDGSCNNLNKPAMGMAGMPYGRFCHDCYSDGKSALPKSKSGKALPNARLLSYLMSPEKPCDDDTFSQLIQPFGQYVTHDMSLTAGVIGNPLRCCDKNAMKKNLADPHCAPIFIPNGDPVYNCSVTPCLDLVRTLNTNDKKCHSPYSSYTPLSEVTAFLDGSMIYGNDKAGNKNIRECSGGRLSAKIRNGQEWPPQQPDPSTACPGQSASEPCYLSGDKRLNQSPQLTLLHIIYFREHNRICKELCLLNPCWDDETIFQAARRIVIAIIQHITYNHYLPELLGHDMAVNKKLIYPDNKGWVDDYDSSVDVSSMVEFATAAFRFYHSMVHGEIEMFNADRQKTSSIFLKNSYFQAAILEQGSNFADLARGCANQPVRMSDQYYDYGVTKYLFTPGDNELGSDLRAVDIQRAREHGVCTYVEVRKTCGLPVPTSFCDLLSYGISQENVDTLEKVYECVEDCELTVVGPLEPIVPGTRAGETFLCVLAEQFLRVRTGDRYFYQNGQDPVSMTLDQLKAIQAGTSISRLFCDNVPFITAMQPNGFRQISFENEYTPCDQLPRLDLQYWKDSEC